MAERKIPKTITPCPIKSVSLEIRFQSELNNDAIQKILFSIVREKITEIKHVSSVEAPGISTNLNIINRVSLICDGPSVSYAQKSILFESVDEYIGWDAFHAFVEFVLTRLEGKLLIKKIDRLGLRYINFFKKDQSLKNIAAFDFNLTHIEANFTKYQMRTEFQLPAGTIVINLAEGITLHHRETVEKGCVLDIDVSTIKNLPNSFNSDLFRAIKELHLAEGKVFFELLTDDFYNSLKKEY